MISSKFNSIFFKNNFFRRFLSTNLSEFKGNEVEVANEKIQHIIERQAKDLYSKDAISITSLEYRWTFEEFHYHIDTFGFGMSDSNLDNQKKIASHLPNIVDSLLFSLSAPFNRSVHVPFQYPSSKDDLFKNLKLVNPSGFVFGDYTNDSTDLVETLFPQASQNFSEIKFKSSEFPALKRVIHTGSNTINGAHAITELLFKDSFQEALYKTKYHHLDEDFVLGSINDNKLALFNQSNFVKSAYSLLNSCEFSGEDRIFIGLDFHSPSAVSVVLSSIIGGSFSVINGKEFNADLVLKTCKAESASILVIDSDKVKALSESSQLTESSLKKLVVLNNPKSIASVDTLRFISKKLNLETVYNGFSVPETNTPFLFTRILDSETSTLGSAVPLSHIKVVDSKNQVIPVGSKGTLLVKGPQVMSTYSNQLDNNNVLDSNGWLNTKLTGYADASGDFILS